MDRGKREFERQLLAKVKNAVFDTHRVVVMEAPVKTGRLRGSIHVEELPQGWIIFSNLNYSPYVELNTAPHKIEAKNAKALHWTQDGQDMFAKSVMHPGTEGHHMFLKGRQHFESKLQNFKSL